MQKLKEWLAPPLFVVTADMHLQDRAWNSRPIISGDAIAAFHYIIDFAAHHKLSIIAAGDLIDKKKNEALVINHVAMGMAKLEQTQQCDFYYVQGQHDLQPSPWFSAVSPWPVHLDRVPGDRFGYELTSDPTQHLFLAGVDWSPKETIPQRLADFEHCYLDILVMHQTCKEFMGFNPELDWGEVPRAKVLVVGDYHGAHCAIRRMGKHGQELLVLSPGSTAMQSIDEPEEKKFFVLHEDLHVESYAIPSRPVMRCPHIATEEDMEDFCKYFQTRCNGLQKEAAALPEHLRLPLVDVSYDVAIPNAYARILDAVPHHDRLFPQEVVDEQEHRITVRNDRDEVLSEDFVEEFSQSDEETKLAKRLLASRDISRTLEAARDAYFEGDGYETS